MVSRQVREGRQLQGVDEKIIYKITTTPWGGTPTNISFVVWDVTNGARTDVTSTVAPGSATVNGDVITLPKVSALTDEHLYRVEVKFDSGGNTLECYFEIKAEV